MSSGPGKSTYHHRKTKLFIVVISVFERTFFGNGNENRSDGNFFIHIGNEFNSSLCIESRKLICR